MKNYFISEQHQLPLAYEAEGHEGSPQFLAEFINTSTELNQQLLKFGAILFRGFQIDSEEGFEALVRAIVPEKMAYVDGNSPRTDLGKGVYTSTEFPPEAFISLHNELSYAHEWPQKLYFCCVKAAEHGGETPLADSRKLLETLPSDLVDRFQRKNVKYIRNLHGGNGPGVSWQKTYKTDNQDQVSELLTKEHASYRWNNNGSLYVEQVRDAIQSHPVTEEALWFNQADQFHASGLGEELYEAMKLMYAGQEEAMPQHCFHGDGTPILEEDLDLVRDTTRELYVKVKWEQGDFLIVDNMLVSHGRMPFEGTRRVLVSMSH